MRVKQLIAALQVLDPDALVVLAKDREGNGYGPLDVVVAGHYLSMSGWAGDFQEWGDNGDLATYAPAVCLGPVN